VGDEPVAEFGRPVTGWLASIEGLAPQLAPECPARVRDEQNETTAEEHDEDEPAQEALLHGTVSPSQDCGPRLVLPQGRVVNCAFSCLLPPSRRRPTPATVARRRFCTSSVRWASTRVCCPGATNVLRGGAVSLIIPPRSQTVRIAGAFPGEPIP